MLGRASSLLPLTNAPQGQQGLTLIELMIGLVVGLIVVSGVLTVYLAVISSSSGTLKSSKLNLEMGAIMSVMVNDIRRAGRWGNPSDELQENPYAQVSSNPTANDGTALEIHDSMASDTNMVTTTSGTTANLPDIYVPNGTGSCILYAYDSLSTDGGLQAIDLFGFRLNGSAVDMREKGGDPATTSTNSCNTGDWGPMNDTNVVAITALEFDMQPVDTDGDGVTDSGSTCLISNEPNEFDENGDGDNGDAAEQNCYLTSPFSSLAGSFANSYVTAETRVVTIRLVGELVNDPDVRAVLNQTVRVRNDLLRVF